MNIIPTPIVGVMEVQPQTLPDDRGFFARIWDRDEFVTHGIEADWMQENLGHNPRQGTLRGLHFQQPPWAETKLVRCTRGRVFDVAVDLREDSPTRYRWVGAILNADDANMLVVPPGCAHGYLTLEVDSDVVYRTSAPYVPEVATGVRFDDPVFSIDWPAPVSLVSDRDRSWPLIEVGAGVPNGGGI